MTDLALPLSQRAPRRWREPSALPGFAPAFGFTLFYATLIIALNLLADVIYALLDPRVRLA